MSLVHTVARNALFSYGRTLISACVTLFSSRWILSALGASDYGIYGLVGGLLVFISLISGVLSQGANRYIAFAIGEGKDEGVAKWFNVAANIYWIVPLVVLPLGLLLGEYMVRSVLNIPADRIRAALWVVRFSLIACAFAFWAMPYQSLLIARQYIHVTSMISLIRSFGLFFVAMFLPYVSVDRLIVYAGLVVCCAGVANCSYVLVCRRLCPEGRISFTHWWDYGRMKDLASYSGWMFVGSMGMFLRDQGVSIIVNWARGTIANAGRSIGNQLGYQTETMYNAFASALNPELARREGAGTHEAMLSLAKRSQRLGIAIMLLVGIPLFCECEYVLKLWLKNPPEYAVFFTRIQILVAIICRMRIGHMMCFQAIGKVRPQQIVDCAFFVVMPLALGLVYLMTRSFDGMFYSFVACHVVYLFVYAYVGSRCFAWTLGSLMREIVIPSILIFTCGLALGWGMSVAIEEMSFCRFCLTTIITSVFVAISSCVFILKSEDRLFMRDSIIRIFQKVSS